MIRRIVASLLALAALTLAQPCEAAIGTPVSVATLAVNVASGSAVTTSTDAPIGSLIIVEAVGSGAFDSTVSSCTLSSGDTLSLAVNSTTTSGYVGVAIFYASNTAHDLPSGGSVSCTANSAVTVAIYKVSGGNGGLDQTNTTVHPPTTSGSIATGTLATASELAFGTVITGGCIFGTWTEGSGFTTLANASGSAFANAYDIASSTTAVTYAPSWSASCAYTADIATFKATSSAPKTQLITLLGVGS